MTVWIEALGDCALLVQLGERIDTGLNAQAIALADALNAARLPGVRNIVAAYASVCLQYDPLAWTDAHAAGIPYERIVAAISPFVENATRTSPGAEIAGVVEIPVCYGGEFGPDLADVAAYVGGGEAGIIERHSHAEYRVAMLGFAPGFPYLSGLDPSLHMPRRAHPRTRVPAGSVAIGGAQTGIYPRELPGGWNIVGRTPLRLFDAARDPPALLAPGRRVRFRAIGADEFAALAR